MANFVSTPPEIVKIKQHANLKDVLLQISRSDFKKLILSTKFRPS